ncbi:UDP-glucose/GDP-mannose dehydrogenase family protein [Bacillus sp. ISL-47]|uniref:UDP-glucose dehydrogenase family protein n=1 Tax=Bacillus sp. ISL-47 TaxID=2819130 RepID=UPI001BEC172F|nr:UDP-glucose/GDP-mannose dehydrogenase family protein [Bacillus sp. ISL-47]MBT2687321.1 UDP-glucose/GDP-mannose dehydrogenase family protein [Bacillus sp. ISL-47]MBT2706609.1 UDP-glucose/GDP-mannose dehydrogenase family protein [Pseudomonas sp. ISL-84]
MNITIAGAGYVGLVTSACLAEVGHTVICFDKDIEKIEDLNQGRCPIFEPGLQEMISRNRDKERLLFTDQAYLAYGEADCIFITVGTPQKADGSADTANIEQAALDIAEYIQKDVTVAIKSTVPIGTNERIEALIMERVMPCLTVHVVSNPEFLREGSGIYDTFHGDRIVIGSRHERAASIVEKIYQPFNIPVVQTDLRSAEMIKYASNTFLAAKISFINEIANLCDISGANIEDVSAGMGMDKRIGNQFLNAGIGYGGSCFPKDTQALEQMALQFDYDFIMLRAVMEVNNRQKQTLYRKAKNLVGNLSGKRAAVLGLSFKPNTDDIREAPSLDLIRDLLDEGANIAVYDPAAMEKGKCLFGDKLSYVSSIDEAIQEADMAFIVTEWKEIKEFPLYKYREHMKDPLLFDGRNCYSVKETEKHEIQYVSIGRPGLPDTNPT